MSIILIKKPNAVDFLDNGLKYKIKGTYYIENDGDAVVFYFKKIGNLTVGDSFYIHPPYNPSETIMITAVVTPRTWHNEVTAGKSIEETAEEINNLFDVLNNFTVSVQDTDKLVFTAIEKGNTGEEVAVFIGTGYDFNVNFVTQSGVAKITKSNYHINCIILYENKILNHLKIDVTEEGISEIEIGKFLNIHFDKGNFPETIFQNIIIDFYKIGFWEQHYNTNSHLTFHQIKILPGKINFNEYPDYNLESGMFFNLLKKVKTFNNAFNRLTFFSGNKTFNEFFIEFYYEDGTSNIHNESLKVILEKNSLYQIDFFVADILLKSDSNKKVYRFDIYFPATNAKNTDIIKFYISDKLIYDKQFLFKNSFGFWEVIKTSGYKKEIIKTERNIYKRYVTADYKANEGAYKTVVKKTFREFEINTGSKLNYEIQQIASALASEYFFEINISKRQYVKCEIITDSVQIRNEEKQLQNITFQYRYSFDD